MTIPSCDRLDVFERYRVSIVDDIVAGKGVEICFVLRDESMRDRTVRAFLRAQIDHAEALIALGKHADTQLIARSMLEGAALLRYLLSGEDRCQKWYDFMTVSALAMREFAPPEGVGTDDVLEDAVRERALDFRRGPKVATAGVGRPFARSDFEWNWTTEKITKLIKTPPAGASPEDLEIHETIGAMYSSFSEWHHWQIAGLWSHFNDEKWQTPEDVPAATAAVNAAGYSLRVVLNVARSKNYPA